MLHFTEGISEGEKKQFYKRSYHPPYTKRQFVLSGNKVKELSCQILSYKASMYFPFQCIPEVALDVNSLHPQAG